MNTRTPHNTPRNTPCDTRHAGPTVAVRVAVCAATWVGLCAMLLPLAASAFDFQGDKRLVAVFRDGGTQTLGQVSFSPGPQAPEVAFKVKLNTVVLTDFFLSMREFKCLPAAAEITCVVPYPYAQPGTLTPTDLRWLEHSLLFLFKQPSDFGAKLWNGVIFKFTATPNALVGTPEAVDLNLISAPPDDTTRPPYGSMERSSYAPGARWLSSLRIE